jgi:hypothetical protein
LVIVKKLLPLQFDKQIKIVIMVIEVKEITEDNIAMLLEKTRKPRKTLADVYGKLKRGLDGMEYQNEMRNGWN